MLIFALGFAPGLYWLWYFYKRDKWEPEPKKLVVKCYFIGIVVALAVMLLQLPFNYHYFLGAVIIAPILEELAKFLGVRISIYGNREFDEPMDGIVYTAAVALGFASIENAFYLLRINNTARELFPTVLLARSLLSVPGHALFSSFWGYALGLIKTNRAPRSLIIPGLAGSMIAHGLFNYLCFLRIYSSVGLLILLAVLWSIINNKIKKALLMSPDSNEE
jgi:RsiW-degrading membrane proteinase PrsW (M82 family)